MPFESKAQQRYAYANPEKFGGEKGLKEWSDATDFSKIPERAASAYRKAFVKRHIQKGKAK